MDKVQKIREEVEKRYEYWKEKESNSHSIESEIRMSECQHLLLMLDSMQEEPKFKTGDRIKPIDSCLGSPRTIVDICDSWYVTDQGTLDFEYEDNWELVEEPVSERLAFKAISRLLEMIEPTDRAKAYIAKLADALEVEGYSTDAKIVMESLKIMNGEKVPMATMDEEPVSEGLEKASKEWLRPQLDKSYANYGEAKMMELTHFDGYAMLDAIEFGAKWKEQQFEKNRLKHCNSITNEQAELEQGFIDQHLDKHQRMPTFLDAIEYGMMLQKEKIKKAMDLGEPPYLISVEQAYYRTLKLLED